MSLRATFIVVTTLLGICALCNVCRAYNQALYIRPTESNFVNASCPYVSHSDCHTLNDWIESDSSPFTNDTVVVMLPGLHVIKSEKERVVIENITSLAIIGQKGDTVISCLHRTSFELYNVVDVSIAFVVFRYCAVDSTSVLDISLNPRMDIMLLTLLFFQAQDVLLKGITIQHGGIIVKESINGSTFILKDSEILSEERGLFYSSTFNLECLDTIPLEIIYIVDSNTSIKVINSPCTKVDLRRVLIA